MVKSTDFLSTYNALIFRYDTIILNKPFGSGKVTPIIKLSDCNLYFSHFYFPLFEQILPLKLFISRLILYCNKLPLSGTTFALP